MGVLLEAESEETETEMGLMGGATAACCGLFSTHTARPAAPDSEALPTTFLASGYLNSKFVLDEHESLFWAGEALSGWGVFLETGVDETTVSGLVLEA